MNLPLRCSVQWSIVTFLCEGFDFSIATRFGRTCHRDDRTREAVASYVAES